MTTRTEGSTFVQTKVDDTLEVIALLKSSRPVLDAARLYKVGTVPVPTSLEIPPSTILEVQDNKLAASNSVYVTSPGVSIFGGGTIRGTSQSRTAVYGLIRAENADNLHVDGITLHTSPSVAFWSQGGTGLRISNVTVHHTAADGIHISRGATDFQVSNCVVHDTGDDGIACVAFINLGFAQCTNGLFTRNTIDNVTVGRGIYCGGGNAVKITNNDIDGVDQAGIFVAGGGGVSANVTIDRNAVNNAGRTHVINDGGTGDLVNITQCNGATVSNNTLTNTAFNGINLIDSTSSGLVDGGGNTFAGIGLQNVHHG